ncbi:MAG: NifB/NifX family molybdenum-iron cluster-binding protein [Planctomycetota bacterium]
MTAPCRQLARNALLPDVSHPATHLAVATWDGRIAPLFDVARHIDLYQVEAGTLCAEQPELFAAEAPAAERVQRLRARGATVLICGAISREAALLAEANGLTLAAFHAGEAQRLCTAWLTGALGDPSLTMPGCGQTRRSRRRCRARRFAQCDARKRPSCQEQTGPDPTEPAP